jgi:hypothetical protein
MHITSSLLSTTLIRQSVCALRAAPDTLHPNMLPVTTPREAHLGEAWCPEEDSNLHDFHR